MSLFKNYDPLQVVATFRGVLLLGFAEGTFLSAERTEDAFEMSVGAGGDVTRIRNRNRTGTVTVTLQAESPSNDALSTIALVDEATGLGYGSLLVKDLNGTTLLDSPQAWIRKTAGVEYSDSASTREWAFDCSELKMVVGGAVV